MFHHQHQHDMNASVGVEKLYRYSKEWKLENFKDFHQRENVLIKIQLLFHVEKCINAKKNTQITNKSLQLFEFLLLTRIDRLNLRNDVRKSFVLADNRFIHRSLSESLSASF